MKMISRHAAHSSRGAAGSRFTLGATRIEAMRRARKIMIVLARICRTATLYYYRNSLPYCCLFTVSNFILVGLPDSVEHK